MVDAGNNNKRTRREAAPPPPMTVAEARAIYDGEWVLMKVTAHDEHHQPAEGTILAHSRSRARISKAFAQQPRLSQLPTNTPRLSYYIFNAFPVREPLDVLGEVIAQSWEPNAPPRRPL